MEPTEILAAAREGLTDMGERCARLVEDLEDTSIPIPGSEWTVREAAVHLAVGPRMVAARATGQIESSAAPFDREIFAARMRSMFADNPETDPKKLAEQVREGYGVLLEVIATIRADQPIAYYAGLRPNFAAIASINLGEPLLHGYDIATAVGVPWPIDPEY
ncbi:MAG: maleylpyruvate isomerase N-terminal domain-containing protein, partial [Acidimicrobiia bacterium]